MEIILLSILGIIILIVISGFLAGAETAITGVSQATIHRLKQEGDKRARMVTELRNNKEKLVSALLLGNGICNNYALTLCILALSQAFDEEISSIFAPPIMTFLVFVFSEMVPKTYAFEHSEKYALNTAPVLIRIFKFVYPLINTMQIFVDYFLRKFTKSSHESGAILSSTDELRGAIDLHHSAGGMTMADRDMLGSILDLGSAIVTDVMVHRSKIKSINIDQPILEIMGQAVASNYSRLPVWQDSPDNIVGILNMTDLIKAIDKYQGDLSKIIAKELITPTWFILENTVLIDQLHEFRERRSHLALVINEYGDLKGIVTLEDILEVIVGQIDDEHDLVENGIKKLADESYLINGDASILEVNRGININLPTENSSTIAGFIMYEAERVPNVGDSFEFYGVEFTIKKKFRNYLKKIHVRILPQKDEDNFLPQ